jgi:phage gp45-like
MFEGIIEAVIYGASTFPYTKAFVMGATQTIRLLTTYGYYSNPPPESHIQVLSGDDLTNAFGVADDVNNRPTDILPGEVLVYNTVTQCYVKLDAAMNVTIYGKAEVNLRTEGSVNIQAAQATNITAPAGTTVTSPSIALAGNVYLGSSSGAGQGVARVGDTVQVNITSGSSAGVWSGTIVSGSTTSKST